MKSGRCRRALSAWKAALKRSTCPTCSTRLRFSRKRDQGVGLLEVRRERLLHQHVHPGLEAGARHLVVPLGRHRHHRSVGLAEHLRDSRRSAAQPSFAASGLRARGVGVDHRATSSAAPRAANFSAW